MASTERSVPVTDLYHAAEIARSWMFNPEQDKMRRDLPFFAAVFDYLAEEHLTQEARENIIARREQPISQTQHEKAEKARLRNKILVAQARERRIKKARAERKRQHDGKTGQYVSKDATVSSVQSTRNAHDLRREVSGDSSGEDDVSVLYSEE